VKPSKYYTYIRYDEYLFEDEVFMTIKYKGNYLWIPLKIIREHDKVHQTIYVHENIFHSILGKATESWNNLCEIYF